MTIASPLVVGTAKGDVVGSLLEHLPWNAMLTGWEVHADELVLLWTIPEEQREEAQP